MLFCAENSTANTTPTKPETLYRVQHNNSFTQQDPEQGFVANGHYLMNYDQWINTTKVQKHLDWKDRSSEPTPFISLFDNLPDAQERARVHRKQNKRGVFIAKIDTSKFAPYQLDIQFSNMLISLHGLRHPVTHTIVLPMREIGPKLNIMPGTVQESEWLALDSVPAEFITRLP